MAGWQQYLEQNRERRQAELMELLSIPSVSTVPAHAGDVRAAVEWAANRLKAAGLEHVGVHETDGHPVAYADWLHAPGKPTILFYGHVDVQPTDPLDLWTSPPFEPRLVGDLVYARGACDMKASQIAAIAALESLLKTDGKLPVNVKLIVEAEEEIGSPNLKPFVTKNRELLACDLVVSADGGQRSETEPSIAVGFRGVTGMEISVTTSSTDLHSGGFGGVAPNANQVLAELIVSLRTHGGRVLVDGFYDDVRALTEADRAAIAAGALSEEEMRSRAGVEQLVGDPNFTPAERTAARPTLDVNGMWGGYQGPGGKTVIPRQAHAKITCRLVPNQEPGRIGNLVEAHLRRHLPPGVTLEVKYRGVGSKPYLMPADHPGNKALADVLGTLYAKPPVYSRSGGTIPIAADFREALGAWMITLGFALPGEGAHAPNEHHDLRAFHRGPTAYVRLLERLAQERPALLRAEEAVPVAR